MSLFKSPYAALQLTGPIPAVRPWNQADAYLLDTLAARFKDVQHPATVNDQYGAVTASLHRYQPHVYNDSAVFAAYLAKNWPSHTPLPVVQPTDELTSADADIFLMRLPKNLHFFRYQLSQLSALPGCRVIVTGMQKHWPASFYQAAYDFFRDVEVLPGVKKAKCMILSHPLNNTAVEKNRMLDVAEFGLTLHNEPNVFSREQLDIGSRFFLEHLPDLTNCQRVLDLACGNGVLGLYALKQYPHLELYFVDESGYAISSCRQSVSLNQLPQSQCHYYHNDMLNGLTLPAMNAVLCNPPFHQQHAVSDAVAGAMIRQSHDCLEPGGVLFLIGNRHLPYFHLLKKTFTQVETLDGNAKFTLYRASK